MRNRAGEEWGSKDAKGGREENWVFEDLIVKIWKRNEGKGPAAYGMPSGL